MESKRLTYVLSFLMLLVVGLPFLQPSQARPGEAGAGNLFALTAPGVTQGQNVLYVIDSLSMRVMVYEHRVGGKFILAHVRDMEYEVQFEQFPGGDKKNPPQVPTVGEVKKMLNKLKKG